MKLASLLLIAVGLSSCVAKPYMVGSVNEQIKPRCLMKYGPDGSLGNSTESTSSSGSHVGGFINPVQSSAKNPVH